MDFRQRLEQSRTRPTGSEALAEPDDFICPYFAIDRGGRPICLDLRLSNGTRIAIPYSYIMEIYFDFETGIAIQTGGKKITIGGRNLGKLFDYLIAYRVQYVQTNIGADTEEDGLFVKEILIAEMTLI